MCLYGVKREKAQSIVYLGKGYKFLSEGKLKLDGWITEGLTKARSNRKNVMLELLL